VIEKEFSVDGSPAVDVRFSSGRLQVKEGQPGSILVNVDGKTDDLFVEQSGSTVTIGSQRNGFLATSRYRITLSVPPGCDITANVASANIQCDPHVGRLNVNSASGDVRFTDAVEVTAHTASGDVHGATTQLCSFVSASGDLHLGTATGKTTASTASGDIYLDEVDGDFSGSSLSGDVSIRRFSGENLKVKAVSGNVRLGIPAGTAVNLDATTRSGHIRLPEPSKDKLEPTGRADVSVSLVSGDLTIKRV
jgi:Toastrack DUF4097